MTSDASAVAVREWTLLAYDWSKIEFGDDHEVQVPIRASAAFSLTPVLRGLCVVDNGF